MSRKLHLATISRDTERGLSTTPGTGTPREDVTSPQRNRRTATSGNEGVGELRDAGKKGSRTGPDTVHRKKRK
jgi:hypothetical protein